MNSPAPIWQPRYTLTPAIARGLMAIEAARTTIAATPLPRAYGLSEIYRQSIGNLSAVTPHEEA
jgi:hypothetical protein